jgi:hypothetical protein
MQSQTGNQKRPFQVSKHIHRNPNSRPQTGKEYGVEAVQIGSYDTIVHGQRVTVRRFAVMPVETDYGIPVLPKLGRSLKGGNFWPGRGVK